MRPERHSASTLLSNDADSDNLVCRWEVPGSGLRVEFASDVVRDLRQVAIQAFLAIPRRGVEIGGLLFGEVRRGSVFHVTAFREVSCQHSFGPSYTLNDLDRKHLAQALERHQQGGSPPVVGFYRSYTGPQVHLDEADQELIQTYFPNRPFLWLLLQPLSVAKCLASFSVWNEDGILREAVGSVFPFDAAQMERGVAEAPAEPPPPIAQPPIVQSPKIAPPPIQTREELPPRPVEKPHFRVEPESLRESFDDSFHEGGGRSRIWMVLLFLALVAIASATVYKLWAVQREPRWAGIRFDARMSGDQLMLSWDPAAP
ncbi:MAG: hypothetical protein QOJ99_2770, partial [Bryobacterales bacterium]|nr:hypothetical protein [Bryobacterales bacterium]